MPRSRVLLPPPHDLLHVLQDAQSSMAQSTAQGNVLHSRVSFRYGHTYPPSSGCMSTRRSRDCVPPPQLVSHVVHALNSDTRQCTGQGPSVQYSVSKTLVSHASPPKDACRTTERVRSRAPAPHEVEQADHADHVAMMQSTGHGDALQVLVAVAVK